MKVNILRAALKDLDDGFLFYEGCEEGVGIYFLDSLYADIMSLRTLAGGHKIVNGFFRKLASRFPYSIFYKVEDSEIRVYAVIDNRRDPRWINERLT
jgi:plasmid stabilization system protein ParE